MSSRPAIDDPIVRAEVACLSEAYSTSTTMQAFGTREDGEAYCHCSLHPAKYPWVHEQMFKTFDHQA